jgi:hypothetical protein
LFTVNHVVNTSAQPIFTFTVDNGGTPQVFNSSAADSAEFATCSSTSCNAANIESVRVDLVVNAAANNAGQAQDDTVVYELSPISQAFQPEVG